MSGSTVSLNVKLPNGTLIQVGGVGADDFLANLSTFVPTDVADHIVKEIASAVTPISTPAPDTRNGQTGVGYQQEQAAAQGQPGPTPPNCDHGWARKWVEGTSKKNNRPYKMWACTADRDQQCEPVWVK